MLDAQYGANKYWSKGYTANLVPTDSQSLAFARTVRQVQNIVYGAIDATQGLFFPEVRLAALAYATGLECLQMWLVERLRMSSDKIKRTTAVTACWQKHD